MRGQVVWLASGCLFEVNELKNVWGGEGDRGPTDGDIERGRDCGQNCCGLDYRGWFADEEKFAWESFSERETYKKTRIYEAQFVDP